MVGVETIKAANFTIWGEMKYGVGEQWGRVENEKLGQCGSESANSSGGSAGRILL